MCQVRNPKDEAAALGWIQRAANQGLGRAQSMIGLFYAQGKGGLKKDLIAAHAWLTLAAENGEKPARRNADTLARGFSPAQRDRSARLREELRAKIAVEPEPNAGASPAR